MPIKYDQQLKAFLTNADDVVRRSEVRNEIHKLSTFVADESSKLAERLLAKDITIDQFRDKMGELLKSGHIIAASIGKGGRDKMTAADWATVGAKIKWQYGYLDKFARKLRAGTVTKPMSAYRARLYSESLWISFSHTHYQNMTKIPGDTRPRVRLIINSAEGCVECAADAARGWINVDDMGELGTRICGDFCKCDLEFEDDVAEIGDEMLVSAPGDYGNERRDLTARQRFQLRSKIAKTDASIAKTEQQIAAGRVNLKSQLARLQEKRTNYIEQLTGTRPGVIVPPITPPPIPPPLDKEAALRELATKSERTSSFGVRQAKASDITYDPKVIHEKVTKGQITTEKINLDNLLTLQDTVNKDRVAAYIRQFGEPGGEAPLVIRTREGKFIIRDGNHRIMAARLLGIKDLEVRVVSDVTGEVIKPPQITITRPTARERFQIRQKIGRADASIEKLVQRISAGETGLEQKLIELQNKRADLLKQLEGTAARPMKVTPPPTTVTPRPPQALELTGPQVREQLLQLERELGPARSNTEVLRDLHQRYQKNQITWAEYQTLQRSAHKNTMLDADRIAKYRELIKVKDPTFAHVDLPAGGVNIPEHTVAEIKKGQEAFNSMVSRKLFKPGFNYGVGYDGVDTRASYTQVLRRVNAAVNMDAGTMVHEMGHGLEYNARGLLKQVIEFYEYRTEGEIPKWLGPGYAKSEKAKFDRWASPYTGKVYRYGWGNKIRATEVLSMGICSMYRNPLKFAKDDPEFFDFIYTVLRGEKWSRPR